MSRLGLAWGMAMGMGSAVSTAAFVAMGWPAAGAFVGLAGVLAGVLVLAADEESGKCG